jgi:hypothetical protein
LVRALDIRWEYHAPWHPLQDTLKEWIKL